MDELKLSTISHLTAPTSLELRFAWLFLPLCLSLRYAPLTRLRCQYINSSCILIIG